MNKSFLITVLLVSLLALGACSGTKKTVSTADTKTAEVKTATKDAVKKGKKDAVKAEAVAVKNANAAAQKATKSKNAQQKLSDTSKKAKDAVKKVADIGDAIQWVTLEELPALMKKEKRKTFIQIYADWCGWCKRLDSQTLSNQDIAKHINENYYAIKFNGEQKEKFVFKDKSYEFIPKGRKGYHEFAKALAGRVPGYPTLAFLDEDLKVLQSLPGFKKVADMNNLLTYFKDNKHKNMSFDEYKSKNTKKK